MCNLEKVVLGKETFQGTITAAGDVYSILILAVVKFYHRSVRQILLHSFGVLIGHDTVYEITTVGLNHILTIHCPTNASFDYSMVVTDRDYTFHGQPRSMSAEKRCADLHVHTTASDGTSTVEERRRQAEEKGLSAISITDHDCIPDVLTTPVTSYEDLEIITGVEIRAGIFDTEIEILGYYVDPENESLRELLKEVRGYRKDRNKDMVGRLAKVTGLELSYESLVDETDGSLGRPHIADTLMNEGLVDSIGEAFDEYLAEGGDCYVAMERAQYDEVIGAIHEAGGVASLAHPGRIRSDRVPEMMETLAGDGLDGVEVWYPYGEVRSEEYPDIGVKEASELADRHGLLKTGGSDCHGPDSGKFRMGEITVSRSYVKSIRNSAFSQKA